MTSCASHRCSKVALLVSTAACHSSPSAEHLTASTTQNEVSGAGPQGTIATGDAVDEGTSASGAPSEGFRFDIPSGEMGTTTGPIVIPTCEVVDDADSVGACRRHAPPDSFEPQVQWAWEGQDLESNIIVTPLVANLTDDDANGTIDLCDVPDVVVVVWATEGSGHVYVLDGAIGRLHLRFDEVVSDAVTPALGDIDNDQIPEIVTTDPSGHLIAFEHDGTRKWRSTALWPAFRFGAIALADMDNDGDVEILAGNQYYDHEGALLWTASEAAGSFSATTAADLDDDGDLEMVLGNTAVQHDGTVMWTPEVEAGFPQVADFDDDGRPEILVTNGSGLSLLEHDGTVIFRDLRPTGDAAQALNWLRPATVHDFDGDGMAEFAVSSAANYSVYQPDATADILWSAPVVDVSGIAAGTAFDFLGDGTAEAMYADETSLFVFDAMGDVVLRAPRSSRTGTEYPVVADVDNDGSAEIVVVSGQIGIGLPSTSPAVQVIRDVQDRWIQARRIWNQHTYHVTNVREDGTIPQFESPSWHALNTFRTNAQIEGSGVCIPQPPG